MATIDVDGLERKLASLSGTASEERVDALIELAWEVAFSDPPRSLELTTEARQISDELGYRRGLAYCRRSDAYAHFLASELQQGLELCD